MKVNISYAVELGEVPVEVDKLLGECEREFRKVHGALDQTSAIDPLRAIEEIKEIRLSLKTLDLRLADCFEILHGYHELLNKMRSDSKKSDTESSEEE
tara:strand:- start:539 stop:832 length:294 start_codon:yes stop_codon:yes gene_type:complete